LQPNVIFTTFGDMMRVPGSKTNMIDAKAKGACEILGLDPLYVANEGKLVAIVSGDIAELLVARMRENVHSRDACIIGEVKPEPQGIVALKTGFGGTRIVDMLVSEQLPRIC
jgi:hydrogenase expression/formation protein HypE